MLEWLAQFGEWISETFTNVLEYLQNLVIALLESLLLMLKDVGIWFFDQMMGVVVGALGLLDMGGLQGFMLQTYIDGLPNEFLAVLFYIGVPECMALIVSASLIRLGMQLIPFVRLGS